MKNSIVITTFILLLSILFISYAKSYDLSFNPKPGQVYSYDWETIIESSLTNTITIKGTFIISVVDFNNDNVTIDLKFNIIKMGPKPIDPRLPGKVNWFSSEYSGLEILSSILREISKISVKINLNSRWIVSNIKLPDDYEENAIKGIIKDLNVRDSDETMVRNAALKQLKERFGEDFFKTFFINISSFFFDKSIAKGKGIIIEEKALNKPILINQEYVLKQTTDKTLTIETKTISLKQTKQLDNYKSINFKKSGKATIDRHSGWILDFNLEQESVSQATDQNGNKIIVKGKVINTIIGKIIE